MSTSTSTRPPSSPDRPTNPGSDATSHLADRMGHEFSNILTIVLSKVDLLAEGLPPDAEQMQTDLDDLRRAARRGAAMTDTMLSFARSHPLDLEPVDLADFLAATAPTLACLLPRGVELVTPAPAPGCYRVRADAGALQQILLNLVSNARDAMHGDGTVTLALERPHGADGDGDTVSVVVADTGAGVAPGIRDRIFQPFFTTRVPGRGVGLGLTLIEGLVHRHGGRVFLEDGRDGGTRACVELPALPNLPAGTDASTDPDSGSGTEGRRILVAEDEEVIRRATKRILERSGYAVIQAADGTEALERLTEPGGRVDLVISDIVMPGLDGVELHREARARGCDSPFLFMSGFQNDEIRATVDADRDLDFLPKPWSIPELVARVREILERRAPTGEGR